MKNINIIFNVIFKIVRKILKFLAISFLVLLVLYIIFEIFYYSHWVYIDSCMDYGGAWNEELNKCEGSSRYDEWYKEWKGFNLKDFIELHKYLFGLSGE